MQRFEGLWLVWEEKGSRLMMPGMCCLYGSRRSLKLQVSYNTHCVDILGDGS